MMPWRGFTTPLCIRAIASASSDELSGMVTVAGKRPAVSMPAAGLSAISSRSMASTMAAKLLRRLQPFAYPVEICAGLRALAVELDQADATGEAAVG